MLVAPNDGVTACGCPSIRVVLALPAVPPCALEYWHSQPCHPVPSMPAAPRTWLWQGWGLPVGLVTPRWARGWVAMPRGPARLPRKPQQSLAPVPGRLLSAGIFAP